MQTYFDVLVFQSMGVMVTWWTTYWSIQASVSLPDLVSNFLFIIHCVYRLGPSGHNYSPILTNTLQAWRREESGPDLSRLVLMGARLPPGQGFGGPNSSRTEPDSPLLECRGLTAPSPRCPAGYSQLMPQTRWPGHFFVLASWPGNIPPG